MLDWVLRYYDKAQIESFTFEQREDTEPAVRDEVTDEAAVTSDGHTILPGRH